MIEMHYTTDGKAWSQTYNTDGNEKKISENQGGEIFAKTRWKGSVLVIETVGRLKMPDQPRVNGSEIFRYMGLWRLSNDGRVLIAELDFPKRLSVYEKLQN